MNPKVIPMYSPKGNPVSNQYIIENPQDNSRVFQSYNTTIAKIDRYGNITITPDGIYHSKTTNYYLSQFLNKPMQDIRKDIEEGIITECLL